MKEYEIGQSVLIRATGEKDIKWWPGEILARKSAVTYLVWANSKERFVHAGEIKKNLTELRASGNGVEVRPKFDHAKSYEKPLAAALLNSQGDNISELDSRK